MIVALASTAGAELVRTVVPRSTLNYLSIPVAEVKGYFRDQGLENQAIVIPGSTAIAALVSGNVDYSGAGGTGMRAALRGAPIKAVMFQTERSPGICSPRPISKKSLISKENASRSARSAIPKIP